MHWPDYRMLAIYGILSCSPHSDTTSGNRERAALDEDVDSAPERLFNGAAITAVSVCFVYLHNDRTDSAPYTISRVACLYTHFAVDELEKVRVRLRSYYVSRPD